MSTDTRQGSRYTRKLTPETLAQLPVGTRVEAVNRETGDTINSTIGFASDEVFARLRMRAVKWGEWDVYAPPEELPTAPYSLVIPPPAQATAVAPYVLDLFSDLGARWVQRGRLVSDSEVQECIDEGWRAIQGPPLAQDADAAAATGAEA